MSNFKRSDRVAEMIQRKLAQIIPQEIKDPRWSGFVTITAVKVSSDLSYAKVYITVLNADIEPTLDILNASAGYLQGIIARSSKLRIVPKIKFLYDESIAYALHLNALIDKANPSE